VKVKGLSHFIYFQKAKTFFRINSISKIMGQFCFLRPYLGIKTVFCRLLQQVARMGMDSSMKKFCQPFQVLMLYLQNVISSC